VNGYVSLSRPMVDVRPRLFPLGRRQKMIAPFWSDIDLSVGSGVVYYRQHGRDSEHDVQGGADSSYVFDAAADIIRRDTGDDDFVPTSVTKITWKDVAPYTSVNTADTQVSCHPSLLASISTHQLAECSWTIISRRATYTVSQKNCATFIFTVTLANVGRFLKFFYCRNQKEIADNKKENFPPHLNCVAALPCKSNFSMSVNVTTLCYG